MTAVPFDLRDVLNDTVSNAQSNDDNAATVALEDKILDMASRESDTPVNMSPLEEANMTTEGEVIPFEVINVQRITIAEISDTYGYLSQKVDEALSEYAARVIPISKVGILSQVSSLKEHDIYELAGVKYAMVKEPDKEVVSAYRNEVYGKLSSGLPYRKSLFVEASNGMESCRTLALTYTEWSVLCSLFADYNPRTVLTPDGDFVLLIG